MEVGKAARKHSSIRGALKLLQEKRSVGGEGRMAAAAGHSSLADAGGAQPVSGIRLGSRAPRQRLGALVPGKI